MNQKILRIGVVGVGRGQSFMRGAIPQLGMKLVAICDTWKEKLREAGRHHKVSTYLDFDRFLGHDMDAVVLANYFHEHAPFAIKALRAGLHVMSETAANSTLAEGVALCRAVEETKRIYMLAENYPFMRSNLEMRRLYRTGEVGRVTYAEGEYNHPVSAEGHNRLAPGLHHWRNWLPSTYYCTHALAPLMCITDARPVSVNALSIPVPELSRLSPKRGDHGGVILCRMDNGAVFRILGLSLPGHSVWYRVHGTRGAMEIPRTGGGVRVWHEEWNLKPGEVREKTYQPEWPEYRDLANKAGHGGGDFWTCVHFARAIRANKQPFLDVTRGVAMSSVGILAWKSALENGAPFTVPDFRKESSRKTVENDHWSPWPKDAAPGQPPPSILGQVSPPRKAIAHARKLWRSMGHRGL